MAYFEDLTTYRYGGAPETGVLHIGWLDHHHTFPQAEPAPELLDRIWAHSPYAFASCLGHHTCDLCQQASMTYSHRGQSLMLGSAELRIGTQTGLVYAAPNLLFHYVRDHHYAPPAAFVEALRASPTPGSEAFDTQMKSLGQEPYLHLTPPMELASPKKKPWWRFW